MNAEQKETYAQLSKADQALIKKKLKLIAAIRDLEAQSAHLNVQLNDRGLTNHGVACW